MGAYDAATTARWITSSMVGPTLHIDDDGIHVSNLDELGVFMLPHAR
jgi:hypothetical protein